MSVMFKAIVTSKSMVTDALGNRGVRLDLTEEREAPPPVLISPGGSTSSLAREVAPIISQVMQSLPFTRPGKIPLQRLTLWLTEDEWEKLEQKPEIGDEVEVKISRSSISINI